MKINRIFNNLKEAYRIRKYEKQEQKVAKYVRIHDCDTYGTSFEQISNARATLANYAMKKGITIDIYDAQKKTLFKDELPARLRNNLYDKFNVVVTNMLNGRKQQRFVSANTDGNTMFHKYEVTIISGPNPEDVVVRNTGKIQEDTFLRNFYRNIEDMTNIVTGKKR